MTKTTKAFILTLALAIILSFGWARKAGHEEEIIKPTEATATVTQAEAKVELPKKIPEKKLQALQATTTREQWLADLIACESQGNPKAINPKDRDGTPSYGLLQFKPSTFEMFSKAYGIEGELMDPEAQKAIVVRMMDDKSVVWENQFPACVRKLGRPPQP